MFYSLLKCDLYFNILSYIFFFERDVYLYYVSHGTFCLSFISFISIIFLLYYTSLKHYITVKLITDIFDCLCLMFIKTINYLLIIIIFIVAISTLYHSM